MFIERAVQLWREGARERPASIHWGTRHMSGEEHITWHTPIFAVGHHQTMRKSGQFYGPDDSQQSVIAFPIVSSFSRFSSCEQYVGGMMASSKRVSESLPVMSRFLHLVR